ncbi:hypothetical protein KP509_35G059700 [Ceratopteris richardii]|uniref:Zinc-ribbon 15 domain-containing protein n=1 Tax=Ceratopteris richardii TaxID=49495 RepID=A0A8T2QHI2_CERRI|nr:hypothetical protein KP509_35G059700 [Ceratopteris richardii]
MFFFFVGGVRQRANIVTYDNVLEILFIPVWRWLGKGNALHCENCGFLIPHGHFLPSTKDKSSSLPPTPRSFCWSCSRNLEPSFKFCPDCGARQDM